MLVDRASDIDDDESAADSNAISEDNATLFAMFKASGLSASLKGEILCHNCLGWGHVAKDKSGKHVCPSAVKLRRPGDCIDGVRFLKLRAPRQQKRLSSCFFWRTSQSAVKGTFWRQAQIQESTLQTFQAQAQEVQQDLHARHR
eukprot:539270-Pleurochrysis_carterae.AAC.1